jgi:hypothetical protein
MSEIVQRLILSEDPCVRYKTLLRVLGEASESTTARQLASQVRESQRVQKLLSLRGPNCKIPGSVYAKFTGAHWILSVLADMDYPPGDETLHPLRDQVYERWLNPEHTAERILDKQAGQYKSKSGVPIIQGLARRCASQEGNTLWSTLTLGIADDRADQLAANLVRWQWPDGGWNCDRKTNAENSSFFETLIPMRALALHGRLRANSTSTEAAHRAAEVFLKRRLFKRQKDGSTIKEDFIMLHYPCYWHYDILFALKVMAEMGYIYDPRCAEALELLASKRLQDGGFPAERKYYKVVNEPQPGGSLVDWGGASRKHMNEYVTVDALYVLRTAGVSGVEK